MHRSRPSSAKIVDRKRIAYYLAASIPRALPILPPEPVPPRYPMSTTGLFAPGTLIAGRYRIDSSLEGEGSAAIYRAADSRLDRAVALRAVPLAESRPGETQQGRAAARLVHANVARGLDFGTDAEAEVEYVVADLGTGGTLAALLAQRGAPPLPLALRMVQEAAAGMAAAHAAGLVHGDLHPGVLWLSRDEGRLRVQVLGLGLDPSGGAPPRTTARYASPERLRRAGSLGAAADVFSLGAIAFELLAGFPEDWKSLLLAMARGKAVVAPSPAEARPELAPHVAHAIRRALVADPADRWTDAGEMAAELFAERAPAAAEEPAPVAVATPAPVAPPAAPEPKPSPRTPALAVTDLADTLYIPPAEPEPAPAAVEKPARPRRERVVAAPARTPAPAPAVAEVPPPRKAVLPAVEAPAPSVALVPVDEVPAADIAVVAGTVEPAQSFAARPRRRGMERLGGAERGRRRGLIAAGVALAVLVGGGVVAGTVLAGPGAPAAPEGVLAAHALAGSPADGAPPVDEPPAEPLPAESQPSLEELAAARLLVAAPAAAEDDRPADAARQREEELARRQQQRQDSLRIARAAVAAALAAQPQQAPPQPAAPQQVAAAPRTVESQPSAPRIEQAVDAPASTPTRRAADPNRVYGGGEVDRAPALSNRPAFQSAIQRSYPGHLRSNGTWGSAVVSFVVLPDGRVDRSTVTVGEVSHEAFRSAAAAAIAAARFTPARVAGQPVRAQVSMPITWRPPGEERDRD